MVPAQRTRLKILTALIAGSVAMGCGSDGGDKPGGGDMTGDGVNPNDEGNLALELTFSPMYSAFGGSHEFRLPVQVKGASGKLEVTTVPPGFVDYQAAGTTPDGASVVMLTMKKAGDAVVRIKDGSGNTGKADLHVTAATDAEWNVGNDRYNNSILPINVPEGGFPMPDGGFMLPEGGINLDAGFPMGGFGDAGNLRNDNAACASCHVSEGAGGMQRMLPDGGMINVDVEHTPQQTGGYSDEQLITIFTKGQKPENAPFRVLTQLPLIGTNLAFVKGLYMNIHRWDVGADVQKGIIVYLRSLEPKSQPAVDFGGLLPPRGATTPRLDGGTTTPSMDGGTTTPATEAGTTSDAGTGTTSDAGATTDAGTDAS